MAGSRPIPRLAMAATLLAAVVASCGCTSAPTPAGTGMAQSMMAPAAASQAALPSLASIPLSMPAHGPAPRQPTSPQAADPQAMREIVAEIQAIGALDPQARDELLDNLRRTDPAVWPLVAQRMRADLAWRRQAEARRHGPDAPDAARAPAQSPRPGDGVAAGAERPSPPEPPGPPPAHYARKDATADRSASSEPVAQPACHDEPPARGSAGAVTAASYQSQEAGRWQGRLDEAVELLASQTAGSPRSEKEFAEHARLRLLYLLEGRREEALRPIPGMAPAMQEFWSKQLYGLAMLLNPEPISEPGRRQAEARQHLDAAVAKLGESCPLGVRNLAFVTDIDSFGTYKPFDKYEFAPGQRVLLYAEVENFKSVETPKGFHTATRSSYQIFDADGKRVAEHEFSLCEEYCRRARRDFFIVHDLNLPQRIYPGKHTLQLTVSDLNGEKAGQSVIEFTIKAAGD